MRAVHLSNEPFDSSPHGSGENTSHIGGSNMCSSSHAKGSNSSQPYEYRTSQTSSESKIGNQISEWIKKEAVEEHLSTNGGNEEMSDFSSKHDSSPSEQTTSPQSIINRPQSLIPLANISKKFSSRALKSEVHEEELAVQEEKLPSQDSILRSLYDQPVFGVENTSFVDDRSDSPSQLPLALPQNLRENLDNFPATSENLVLAGYYDADNYPRYRQSRKNPAKKSKTKEKHNASGLSLAETPSTSSQSQEMRMRTFESGGRLVYACDVCKRELSHLTSYRRHMKLHTMERPHKCPVCSKGFIRKYHCIDHMNKHHKDVEFDAETLTLTGQSRALYSSPTPSGDNPALSDSYSISPSEYTYTLDQSLDSISGASDANQSMNISIDHSASSMLSELAKSAARQSNQKDESKQSPAPRRERNGGDSVEPPVHDKGRQSSQEISKTAEENADTQSTLEIAVSQKESSVSDQQSEHSPSSVREENSAMARKQEVSAGIKAIVAHLKSSSRRKKMMNVGEKEASKKQVLEETK